MSIFQGCSFSILKCKRKYCTCQTWWTQTAKLISVLSEGNIHMKMPNAVYREFVIFCSLGEKKRQSSTQVVLKFQMQQYASVLKNYINHFCKVWLCLFVCLFVMGMIPSLTWAPVSKCPAGWVSLMLLLGYYSHWGNLAPRVRPSLWNPLLCSPVVSVSTHWDQC